ncbi:HEAT repeat domain-containing protein [Saccharopolyspora taberi]|uniref:NACHT domain-containing protein n=1 Tax=Saccharopolyspora taberi TaxID=60895 RepID=A0ABN3VAE5_9PSEU
MARGDGSSNSISGGAAGPTVQAGTIHGGVHFHLGVPESGASVPETGPVEWSELPELPVEIRSLLHAQVQAAHELPYRLPGARRPSLTTVYVRQELGSGTEEQHTDQPQPAPVLDERGQLVDVPSVPVVRLAVRPPSRTVREVLDGEEHLLITGGPGQGKSTLSLRLTADVAARWAGQDDDPPLAEPVVPLRLTARELAARLDLSFPEALAASVRAEYGALLRTPVDARLLGGRVAGCRWLLLVDALDEVADSAERDRLVTVLASWASDPAGSHRVVVTTRPIEGAALAPLQRIGCSRYELQPFDEQALRRFAENWFDDAGSARRFVRQVREAHLDELVQVPLLATIAAIIFQQHEDRPLPDNQYELYEAYLAFLLHARTSGPFEGRHTELLEHLGRVRLETDTSLVTAARDWAHAHLPASELPPSWQEDLTTFLTSVGPLVVRGDDLRFLHHSFAEHLAATAKARALPEQFDPDDEEFTELLHAARPKEHGRHARAVLLHYTRLRPTQADRMVRWLHAGNSEQHLLAARLLAKHVPASTDVVDAFLETVHGWAMTTRYPASDILAQASRAAHHPALVRWLTDLMHDENAPWQSRTEAAAALAVRLRCDHNGDALTLLRAAVDDPGAGVEHRLAAAETLAQCGNDEREAAERGLRSVLCDPAASGASCRTAAVVLSVFGARAREDAVAALSALLADDRTPTQDAVDAATGLVEIGVEFSERSAEVFRAVLRDPVQSTAGRRDAALGLASLGPRHVADAVEALTALCTDRRHNLIDRSVMAETLAELGPQSRVAAGELLLGMSQESELVVVGQWFTLARLVQCGPKYREHAADQLRAMLAKHRVVPNSSLWAASSLIELGPEFHAEAAQEFHRQLTDPLASPGNRVTALGELAELGEPHRGPALRHLRAELADFGADAQARCDAAAKLVRSGPEFHDEAAAHLVVLARSHQDPLVSARAWRELLGLRTTFRDESMNSLLDLLLSKYSDIGVMNAAVLATTSPGEDPRQIADALRSLLADTTRELRIRVSAARSLVSLGRSFHGVAVEGIRELLRSELPVDFDLSHPAEGFAAAGRGHRAALADVLKAVMHDAGEPSARRWYAVAALDVLGFATGPDVEDVLRSVIGDEAADVKVRLSAVVALARLDPGYLGDAVTEVLQLSENARRYMWWETVIELSRLGAEIIPPLRALLADTTASRNQRELVASILPELCPDLTPDAVAELRDQAEDDHLSFWSRTDVQVRLAELDPSSRDEVAAQRRTVLEDENATIRDRCEAAYRLALLRPDLAREALSALRHFSTDVRATPAERATAVNWLGLLYVGNPDDVVQLALGILRDPAFRAHQFRSLLRALPPSLLLDAERDLLADRTAPIESRIPGTGPRAGLALRRESETAIREEITAAESLPTERVAAAAALAVLSPRHLAEARELLERFIREGCAPFAARRELAKLTGDDRQRVLAEARSRYQDTTLPRRERRRALALLLKNSQLPDLASDEPPDQPDVLYTRRHEDGLRRLRALRDDDRTRPATRWKAAMMLRPYAVEDRAAAASTLNALATDPEQRPALRWRVARDLAKVGARGHRLAIDALHLIAGDDALPVTARAHAAQVLGEIAPSRRRDALALLESLLTSPNPLHRNRVLRAIGFLAPADAVLPLRAMAKDESLGPVVRLRCAGTLVQLHRGYRDTAAAVAREIALDESAARNTRLRAARALARWSEVCRAEARQLIHALVPQQ